MKRKKISTKDGDRERSQAIDACVNRDACGHRDAATPRRKFTRRSFLQAAAGVGLTFLAEDALAMSRFLVPVRVGNPLESYPNREWEKVYRDLYNYDSSFHFLCAPNDTHNCYLRAYVKNGVAVRLDPSFGYGKATDYYGNQASHRWDPRCCQKGLAMVRRIYGDRRVKHPMVRKGFKEWADQGFPRDPATGLPPPQLLDRGFDSWVKVPWDEAEEMAARALANIAETYSGEKGKELLKTQGYDEAMIESMEGAGVRTLKFRGGMPLLGATRIFAQYRLANSMALLDSKIRGVPPEKAVGARGWDNYSWHTDLPPGHPMVTGQQTLDWDLVAAEQAKVLIVWGMNWITTKMPDAHWLTEARIHGTKVVVIACEYSATCCKGDEVIIVRPGTTPALALGLAQVVIREKLYDLESVRKGTDLPLLVRMDTLKFLKAGEVISGHKPKELTNYIHVTKKGEAPPPPTAQATPFVSEDLRNEWGDFMVWDLRKNSPQILTHDDAGEGFSSAGLDPALEGEYEVSLPDGKKVKVRPVFSLIQEYLDQNFSPEEVSEITWAPEEAVVSLARLIASHKGETLFAVGMGPNQFFNNDLKDRAIFLLAALTSNVGKVTGSVGSYAGNYRAAQFNGLPQFIGENPFDIELAPEKMARPKIYFKAESAHYFNHDDKPLRMGKKLLTGKTHIPSPTKSMMVSNSNSLIGNIKGHYNVVFNTLKKVEFVAVNEWWWTVSCEYADIVFPVDSWAEFEYPDLTASCTNPFLYVFPRTPLQRIFDTRSDLEVAAGIGQKLAKVTGEQRFAEYWKFVHEGKSEVYLQRIINASNQLKGYDIYALEEKAKEGIPSLVLSRTYPKVAGWEQGTEGKPWYTKTGRLEFYRDEGEFIEAGENLPVYREPIDATFYEPNVIVAKHHPAIKPATPDQYGVPESDLSGDTRQGRNVVRPWDEVKKTQHPLMKEGFSFIFHTPKYRHGAHTTPVDVDIVDVLFGPFGDFYRHDKRSPYVGEAYVDLNPLDGRELGLNDGDYVWIDADPEDRPFKGWKERKREYKVARLLCRVRFYPGTPRKIARMWHNQYAACHGSVEGHEKRKDGLAKSPETGYQSLFRYGSHQSCTRGWIKPTHMTDSLVRKELFGQGIGKGFVPDVHCPTGAPRESFVKITKAEDGGIGGKGLWRPAKEGIRPTYESESMKKFLAGEYIRVS